MQLGGTAMAEGCLGLLLIAERLEVPSLAHHSIPSVEGLPSSTPWRLRVPLVPLVFTRQFLIPPCAAVVVVESTHNTASTSAQQAFLLLSVSNNNMLLKLFCLCILLGRIA